MTIGKGHLLYVPVLITLMLGCASTLTYAQGGKNAYHDSVRRGRTLFRDNCFVCHEPYSRGAKILTGVKINGIFKRPGVTDKFVFNLIKYGPTPDMPGFRYMLSNQQINDIIAYLKTIK